MIEVKNLTRTFGDLKAVDSASFTAETGQVFGFIGPNGAGKTTTLRILATLDTPDSGDGYINGHSVVNEPETVRSIIGFLPDKFGVYKNMTIRDYLEFFGRSYGLAGRELENTLDHIMDFTDVMDLRNRRVRKLSAGMKQRLCLARTLINDPDVLLLDEPAANLDPRARVEIRELIKELARLDKTIMVSSHILAELSEICDALAIIEQGKILVSGTVEEALEEITPGRELEIRFLDSGDDLLETLAVMPMVNDVTPSPPFIRVHFSGTEEDVPEFINNLLEKNLHPVEVKFQQNDLEDIFMEATEGSLQ